MKTILLLILSLAFSLNLHAQIDGRILAPDRSPIPYVNVLALTDPVSGTTTNEEGTFHLNIKQPVNLYISAVGYRDTLVPCHPSKFKELVLQKKNYDLAEVLVTPYSNLPMVIGYPDAEPIEGWQSVSPAIGKGIFYIPKKKEIGTSLTSIQIYIHPMGKYQTPLAIRLMSPQHAHIKRNRATPTADFIDLLPEPLILKAEQPGWQTIDLSAYNLQMPPYGLVFIYSPLDAGEECKWTSKDGRVCYGAVIANSQPAYTDYRLISLSPEEQKLFTYDSPLLKDCKPLIVFHLNEKNEK